MSKAITCIADEKQLAELKNMGFSEVALHIIDKDITPQKMTQILSQSGMKTISVHAPFTDKKDVLIENLSECSAIHLAAMTADLLCKGEEIFVVCHTELGNTAAEHPEMLYKMIEDIDHFLSYPPNIVLAIENTMVFNSDTQSISQSVLPNYTEVIKAIKNRSKYPDRICSVLDICHAQSTVFAIKQLFPGWKITLADYFRVSTGVCRLIHFANSYAFGYTKATHGTGFNAELHDEKLKLQTAMKLIDRYLPDAKFVYEISESDYSNRVELNHTLNSMKRLGFEPF